ncbi:sulfate ABC transporter substrate-binding protein [Selenomonas sp.]|uniref:sulfate ABC transporter substrate-binding protein n=1 Tax=Selenomonas sp. TaxID=2053611 RepID=UPI002A831B2F|nr:sulfate ABC transporter substrate-binding protein [Selenomonas sp.]MDY4417024.1 sulfate ABC transporter substrate-binding protein [Selenomonas sp.]
MKAKKWLAAAAGLLMMTGVLAGCGGSDPQAASSGSADGQTFLNVSYDPTRELYQAFNESFSKKWTDETGEHVNFTQSHGGSGKQARSVREGLEADVVTLALAYDVDEIAATGLIDKDWIKKFPNNSAPYTSTIVFLVRKGNPKNIHDWDDLVRDGIEVVTPNPKTSGGARWNYLGAWAYAEKKFNGDEGQIKGFIKKLFQNVVALDSGARGATTSFVQRGQGDVLIAWENEALLSVQEAPDKYEIVVPSLSILAEPSVAVVDEVVDQKGTRKVAEAYINYLYSKEGQEIAAKNFYRPRDEEVAAKYKNVFPALTLVTIDDAFGGWQKAQKEHFADGGTFDQIYEKK